MRYATASSAPAASLNLLWVIYLVAGGIVSATHHYWNNVHALKPIVSAILAVLLWPLLLVGINLHIHQTASTAPSSSSSARFTSSPPP